MTVPDGAGASAPVLLTGFEPFDGRPANASWAAAQWVADGWTGTPRLVVVQLPVSFRRARQVLRAAVAEHIPQLVVCLGETGERGVVTIEEQAVNLIDARLPDNDGSAPVGVPVIAGTPGELPSGLPLERCRAAGAATGVPVELSPSAGGYVCNATFYALLHVLGRSTGVRGGFVHVPLTPESAGPGRPAMTTSDAGTAVTEIIRAALADPTG